MNLSLAQGNSRRASLANKETQRLANENTSIKKETKGLWRFLEKVGLSASASDFTGIQASTRTPERHQSIREASVSTPTTTTTSEEPASPPQTQRSAYAQSGAPGTDVTDFTPSATLSAESSLPSLPSSLPSSPPAPPPPPPPPPPTRRATQRDTLDSIKGGLGVLALRPKDDRVALGASRAKKPADEVAQPANEMAVNLAARLAVRRSAIEGKEEEEDEEDWDLDKLDFGRARRPKTKARRPSKTKTRPYL